MNSIQQQITLVLIQHRLVLSPLPSSHLLYKLSSMVNLRACNQG